MGTFLNIACPANISSPDFMNSAGMLISNIPHVDCNCKCLYTIFGRFWYILFLREKFRKPFEEMVWATNFVVCINNKLNYVFKNNKKKFKKKKLSLIYNVKTDPFLDI